MDTETTPTPSDSEDSGQTAAPAPAPAIPNLESQELWDKFSEQCKELGFTVTPDIQLKTNLKDSISPRELKLVQSVVDTYLFPIVKFTKK